MAIAVEILNEKKSRAKKLAQLNRSMFENHQDFFMALHLNQKTAFMHLIASIIGLAILPYALYTMEWWVFLLCFVLGYGLGSISHIMFDGLISPTTKELYTSTLYALKLSWIVLSFQMGDLQERMFKKYPFLADIYLD